MRSSKPIPRLSAKKLAALKGKPVYSTIKKKPRKKSETLRIYGPPGYVEWIHEQPCIACTAVGFSEVAHIRTGGMARKDDWVRTVPLCGPHSFAWDQTILADVGCHRILHNHGRQWLEEQFHIDLETEAAKTHATWEAANV